MVFAALLLASGATSARFATEGMNVLVVVFWTNLWMFIMMSAWILIMRPAGGVRTDKLSKHFLRSVFTYSALVTYFYALAQIPFANAVVLQSMGPVFVPILAFLVFRRLADRYVWLGVLISFVGVVMIVQPDRVGVSIGEVAAILAALGGAAAALVIWSMSATEPVERQMFYFSFFALLLSALPLPWTWETPSVAQLTPIIAVAAFTIIGQFYYAKAFSAAPGDKVITWSYMAIVFAAIFGFILWCEPILPLTAVGAALVVRGAHLATRVR
ncbi:DMT family transporter [Roseobacter sinensis]|uniref:DMT family transporter n=1 Tax=Roseobacter sinensis TaxID=2931391 RepID=A0ABT3BLH0_9RHOB|nr:DMT family transporter [Roseobacter sp. WL0113]MCV3274429.1 DMT family transporter [Roseobacter sp. WL0113]